jgi:hypothetical protein
VVHTIIVQPLRTKYQTGIDAGEELPATDARLAIRGRVEGRSRPAIDLRFGPRLAPSAVQGWEYPMMVAFGLAVLVVISLFLSMVEKPPHIGR